MAALSDEIGTVKFVHTYGAGLHSGDADPDVHDPRWQRRQVDDFVEFAVLAEEEHRDALEDYIKVAAENGYARSGANMMIERFVAIGETEDQADRNLGNLIEAFGQFLTLYAAGGRRPIPKTDGEFHIDPGAARRNRPAIAVSGTPGQIADALQQVIDETGARRLLIETFSRQEARLFAREVIPALKEENAAAA
jgi:alkanesulfonate monooxygenase SsuD/methylene tetrahydromethanopterin reductase-like flavin-dependent oxidoreductase (luciferase family)